MLRLRKRPRVPHIPNVGRDKSGNCEEFEEIGDVRVG